jgi:hypothetical protein
MFPPEALRLVDIDPDDDDTHADALVLNVDLEALREAPSFDPGALPDFSVEGWDADLDVFWSGVDLDVTP